MREALIILGLGAMAFALRSSRTWWLRKFGAITILAASFLLFYYLTGSVTIGALGIIAWAFLPWIELLTRIRRMRLPIENRLSKASAPDPEFFPNAPQAAAAMEDEGFEHITDCGWEWDGMHQFFRLYWNPEERSVAAVCLCEQSDVAFAFITITSHDSDGRIWRTTNFPFAPTLRCAPSVRWNHLPCSQNCFHQILGNHQAFLAKQKVPRDNLRVPDPDEIEQSIEGEMRKQIEYNLTTGIIHATDDGFFRYSARGLFFLWGQFVKDMLRFC